jgi:nicotinamide-nucleotide amidase
MSVIFIGNEFKYKKVLQNIILSKVNYSSIYFFDHIDFDIEQILNKHRKILIITNKNSYPTTSKLIATMNDDNLILKDNQLIPEKSTIYDKDSFVVELEEKEINVIKIENNNIPNILINSNSSHIIHIFNYDIDTTKLFLTPLLNSFNINYNFSLNEGGWIECHIDNISENFIKQLHQTLPKAIISNNIFAYIIDKLRQNSQKITFAESCTGGLIASHFTKISGSSDVFDGSAVTYSNEIKNRWLGVDESVLEKYGAVSEPTIKEMLLGALNISNSNIAIAVSGIAGPTGGSAEKPVGTVFIGVSDGTDTIVEKHLFLGNREYIQYQSMMHSIRILINFSKIF